MKTYVKIILSFIIMAAFTVGSYYFGIFLINAFNLDAIKANVIEIWAVGAITAVFLIGVTAIIYVVLDDIID